MSPLFPLLLRGIVFAGCLVLAVFSLLDNGPSHALTWPWFFYLQLALLLPVLWLALRALSGQPLARFGAIPTATLLGFAAWQIVAAIHSAYPTLTLAALPATLLPVAVAFALLAWIEPGNENAATRLEQVGRALALGSAVTAATALLWWLMLDLPPARAAGYSWALTLGVRNLHPLGHWNYTAGIGLLAIATNTAFALRSSGVVRLAWLAGTALGVATLFLAGSRGAFLGFGAWLVAVALVEARARRWSAARLSLGLLALFVVGGALGLSQPRIRQTLFGGQQTQMLSTSDRQRRAMLDAGIAIARDHPWLGVGPGATPRIYPRYRAQLDGGVETALQLHNTPLQVVVDAGSPALAALGVAFAALLFAAWRAARNSELAMSALRLAGPAFSGYLVFSLTDYQLDIPWFGAALGAMLALLGATGATTVGSDRRTSLVTASALGVAIAAFVFAASPTWTARAAYSRAIEELYQKHRDTYDSEFVAARTAAPRDPYFLNADGVLHLEPLLYFVPVSLGPVSERRARAFAALDESLRLDPGQELVHFNLGWARLRESPAQAEAHFRAAAQLVPDKGGVYLGLGHALAAQGRLSSAIDAWALEIVNDPAFATSPVWLGDALRPHTAAVRRRAIELLRLIVQRNLPGVNNPTARVPAFASTAAAAAATLRWLEGDDAAWEEARRDATPAAALVLDCLHGNGPAGSGAPTALAVAAQAASARDEATALIRLREFYARRRPFPADETLRAVAAALRAPDRRAWCLPTSPVPELAAQLHRERTAYGLMMKNLDAPTVRDLYLVQENRIVRDFLPALFPEKGFLPGPVLVALLAYDVR